MVIKRASQEECKVTYCPFSILKDEANILQLVGIIGGNCQVAEGFSEYR